jgi:hypothetical protein
MNSRRAGFDPVREGVGRNQLPSELQHAFEEAIAKYSRWQSGDEPAIMALLIGVADERHADLKNDLENNYASAGQYLLRLIEYRKHQRRGQL